MWKALILVLSGVVFAGCAGMPAKNSTPMAPYNKLVVRDINWNETAVSELTGNETMLFIAAQPRLTAIFREEFGKYSRKTGFFENIFYGDAPAASDTLILVPKIYTLKPGGFMPGASFTGILLTADGRQVGTYASERRLNQKDGTKKMKNIENLTRELGEDAASKLPFAR